MKRFHTKYLFYAKHHFSLRFALELNIETENGRYGEPETRGVRRRALGERRKDKNPSEICFAFHGAGKFQEVRRHVCYKAGDGWERQNKAIMAGIEDTIIMNHL